MRHAILGAGGVGGLIGGVLAKLGDDVAMVVRPDKVKNYPAELSVESPLGSFRIPMRWAPEVSQTVDVLWITVKATQLEDALRSVVVKPEEIGSVVPLLNGIDHVALLRAKFGHDRVVPASIGVESERLAPGKIAHRSPSARLNLSAIGETRLAPAIDKLKSFGFSCQFSSDEQKILWNKLAFLAACALTTAASGKTVGDVNKDPEWRQREEDCVREACAVATASGTPLDPAYFIAFFANVPPATRTSMQKDIAAGNPPELDAIAGPILRGAKKYGLDARVTRELAELVRGKSAAAGRA